MRRVFLQCLLAGSIAVAPTSVAADIAGPAGIYVLSMGDSTGNIRDYEFVDGFTLRLKWGEIDSGGGNIDFSAIDLAIAELEPLGQRLNIEILLLNTPQYVLDASVETWEHFVGGIMPVPWDVPTEQSYAAFVSALASHPVFDTALGHDVPLAEHSVLEAINASVPGINGIRDNIAPSGLPRIVDHVSYSRQKFVDAVVAAVEVNRLAFSNRFGFLGYFTMSDGEDAAFGESLDDTLIGALLSTFNNPGQPTLGLFQELLTDTGPNVTGLGASLRSVSDDTYVMFQALGPWTGSTDPKRASLNPATGIAHGFSSYGATFFEIYIADVDAAEAGGLDANGNRIRDDLLEWQLILLPEPSFGLSIASGVGALVALNARRIRRSTSGADPGRPPGAIEAT